MNETPPPHRPTPDTLCNSVLVSLRKIIQSIERHSRFLVKEYGLTGPQLIVLQEIARAGKAPVGRIAKACSLSQATVTGVLERLEKRGFVSRKRSEKDRRQVLVTTTAAGDGILQSAPPLMQADFVDRYDRLQDWEQSLILGALQRLVEMMDADTIRAAPFLASGPIDEAGFDRPAGTETDKGETDKQ